MKQKRKVKSLLSSKQLFDKGEFKVLLVAGGCTLFLCALSLFTLSVGVALGDNNGAHLSYSGVNDRIEVLYHLGFTNADTLLDKDYMVMSGKSLYVSPRSVVVNEVASCPGWGYSSEWCFSDDNEVSAGNYGNILGGNYNKVSSNNVTIIAGNNNTVRAGNDNVTVLGGKSNIVDSNIFGTPSVMVGGNGNLLGSGSSNAVVGGTGNSITGGAIGSSVLGGSGNKIQGYKGNVIVGGENVVVDGGVNNVFAYSSKSSEFKPESSNAFYLDTNNGLGINVASVDGVTTSGAVSFGEIDINISCNSTIIGLQGSRNGCLVGCTSTSASRDSKRELLDRGSECGKKCRENNRCLAGNEDDSNKPDYPAFCTDNVNINNAHLCSNEKDSYKNVIFETYLVDNGGCPSGIKNKCVYECDEHAKLLTDHTGKHNVDGNPETACFKSCRDRINGKWILHNGRARLYENDEYMCADQCGDHMGDVVCNDGKWYDIGSDGKATEETQKHESCTTMPSSCSAFKLAACPLNGNCSSCAPYTVNNNSCVKGVTGYQLNSCNDVNNCSAITYRVSDDIRTQHSEDSEYGSCDLYEPSTDRTNCGPNVVYKLIGCKGANHTEQGTPSWMQYCIPNTKNVQCLQQGYKPTGSHYVLTGVEITWQGYGETPWKDGSWSTVANCEWECDEQSHEDGGSCASNMKQVDCDNTKPIPEHSHFREPLEQVRVTWYDESGTWSEPTVCPWDCDAPDYEKSQDGSSCVPVASTQSEDCGGTKPEGEGYVLGHSTFQQTCNSLGVCTPTIEDDNGKWKWHHVDAGPRRPGTCEYTCNGSKGYEWDGEKCVERSTYICEGEIPDENSIPKNGTTLNGVSMDQNVEIKLYESEEKAAENYCSYYCNEGYAYFEDNGVAICVKCAEGAQQGNMCIIELDDTDCEKIHGLNYVVNPEDKTECLRIGSCYSAYGTWYTSMLDHADGVWEETRPLGTDGVWKCKNSKSEVTPNSCEFTCESPYFCYKDECQTYKCWGTPESYNGKELTIYGGRERVNPPQYLNGTSYSRDFQFVDASTLQEKINSRAVGCFFTCEAGEYAGSEYEGRCPKAMCVPGVFNTPYIHFGDISEDTKYNYVPLDEYYEAVRNGQKCIYSCPEGTYNVYTKEYTSEYSDGVAACWEQCSSNQYFDFQCSSCNRRSKIDTTKTKTLHGITNYLGCVSLTCPEGMGFVTDMSIDKDKDICVPNSTTVNPMSQADCDANYPGTYFVEHSPRNWCVKCLVGTYNNGKCE